MDDTDIEPAVTDCPACHQPMRAAHIACEYCITDGRVKGRRERAWRADRNRRVAELILWS